MSRERDDEATWLNAGVSYAHKRWLLPNALTLGEIYELGQAVSTPGVDAAESLARACEQRHPELRRHEHRPV